MTSWRRPPTFIPGTPWSQPWITRPWPSTKLNGSPRSQEASNCFLVEKETPTYWTVTFLPGTASAPVPTMRSVFCNVVGALPDGTDTDGFLPDVPAASLPPPLLSFPQADGPRATTAATATRTTERAVRRIAQDGNRRAGRGTQRAARLTD